MNTIPFLFPLPSHVFLPHAFLPLPPHPKAPHGGSGTYPKSKKSEALLAFESMAVAAAAADQRSIANPHSDPKARAAPSFSVGMEPTWAHDQWHQHRADDGWVYRQEKRVRLKTRGKSINIRRVINMLEKEKKNNQAIMI
jgi:hypothetical protein